MNKPITRRKIAPRTQRLRAELRDMKAKLHELAERVDQLQNLVADRTYRLAGRVSLLERGCAYVQVRDGS